MLRSFGLVILFFASQNAFCQDDQFKAKHLFGISLGANVRSHSISLTNQVLTVVGSTINRADSKALPGFELGTFYHLQFHRNFGIRAGGKLSFLSSQVEFESEGLINNVSLRNDESVVIELPINVIFENSEKDVRPTFSLGGKLDYDLTVDTRSSNSINRNSYSVYLEAGAGVAFRFEYFSFRPELIYSYGLSDRGTYTGIPQAAISNHTFNQFALRFSFYGV